MVKGMKVDNPLKDFPDCEACIQAKQHVKPFPQEAETKYTQIEEMTYSDLWGPAQVSGIHEEQYYISFTDGKTSWTMIYFLKGAEREEKCRCTAKSKTVPGIYQESDWK